MGKRMGQWGRWLRTALAVSSRWAWAWFRRVTPPTASWLWTGVKWAAGWAAIGLLWVIAQVLTAVGNWAWNTWPVYAWSIVGAGLVLWALFAVLGYFELLNWVPWVRRENQQLAAHGGTYVPVEGDRHMHEASYYKFEHSHPGGVARHKHDYGVADPVPVAEGPEPEPVTADVPQIRGGVGGVQA